MLSPEAQHVQLQCFDQCLQLGPELRRAFDVWEAMLRQALKPIMFSCSVLIRACSSGQELRRALVFACRKGVRQQRAFELLEAVLHQGLLPYVITYSAVISGCEKGTRQQSAGHPLLWRAGSDFAGHPLLWRAGRERNCSALISACSWGQELRSIRRL